MQSNLTVLIGPMADAWLDAFVATIPAAVRLVVCRTREQFPNAAQASSAAALILAERDTSGVSTMPLIASFLAHRPAASVVCIHERDVPAISDWWSVERDRVSHLALGTRTHIRASQDAWEVAIRAARHERVRAMLRSR